MAAISNTRGYARRPGLKAAARRLGVTYTHLRRVIVGTRSSPALLQKYQSRFGEDGRPLKILPEIGATKGSDKV